MNFDTAWEMMEERSIWDFADKEKSATIRIELDNGFTASLTAKKFFKQIDEVKATTKRAFEKYYARGREEILNGITKMDIIMEGAVENGREKEQRITA